MGWNLRTKVLLVVVIIVVIIPDSCLGLWKKTNY